MYNSLFSAPLGTNDTWYQDLINTSNPGASQAKLSPSVLPFVDPFLYSRGPSTPQIRAGVRPGMLGAIGATPSQSTLNELTLLNSTLAGNSVPYSISQLGRGHDAWLGTANSVRRWDSTNSGIKQADQVIGSANSTFIQGDSLLAGRSFSTSFLKPIVTSVDAKAPSNCWELFCCV